ncbi:hypothetical protein LEP1GSC026_0642 [Leptospira interrogans str. 2002000623]|nr:hypothetical protein LEP1GSC026_0642 [Leptospira interrogans str. 2002000623]
MRKTILFLKVFCKFLGICFRSLSKMDSYRIRSFMITSLSIHTKVNKLKSILEKIKT